MSPKVEPEALERRRSQILQAALACFSRKGYYNTTMRDIQAEAGLSKGGVYHHFGSKEELFMSLFEHWLAGIEAGLEAIYSTDVSATEKLTFIAQATGQLLANSADFLPVQMEFWAYMLHNEAVRERFKQFFARYRAALGKIIAQGIEQGEFRTVDPEQAASLALAAYDGLVLQWVVDREAVDWPALGDLLVDGFINGLRKR